MHLQSAFARHAYASRIPRRRRRRREWRRRLYGPPGLKVRDTKWILPIREKGERVGEVSAEARGGGGWEEGSIEFFHGMSPVSHPKWRGASVWRHPYTSGPDSNREVDTPRSHTTIGRLNKRWDSHRASLFAALFRFFCRFSADYRPRDSTFSPPVVTLNKMTLESTQKNSRHDPRISADTARPVSRRLQAALVSDTLLLSWSFKMQRYNFMRDRSLLIKI